MINAFKLLLRLCAVINFAPRPMDSLPEIIIFNDGRICNRSKRFVYSIVGFRTESRWEDVETIILQNSRGLACDCGK